MFEDNASKVGWINPLSTTGLLSPFLIGSYHETSTSLASPDKAKKMLHHKLSHETSFSNILSDWFNKWQNVHLTNRQVVLMGLIMKYIEDSLFQIESNHCVDAILKDATKNLILQFKIKYFSSMQGAKGVFVCLFVF